MAIVSDWSDFINRIKANKGRQSCNNGRRVRKKAANRDLNKNKGSSVRPHALVPFVYVRIPH